MSEAEEVGRCGIGKGYRLWWSVDFIPCKMGSHWRLWAWVNVNGIILNDKNQHTNHISCIVSTI